MVLALVALAIAAVAAGGPVLWAIAVMGLPFIALFALYGFLVRRPTDNGHFRTPDKE
jgi:hypothetical protein